MTRPRPQGVAEVECGQNPASSAMGLQDSWLGTSFNTVPIPFPPLNSCFCWMLAASTVAGRAGLHRPAVRRDLISPQVCGA